MRLKLVLDPAIRIRQEFRNRFKLSATRDNLHFRIIIKYNLSASSTRRKNTSVSISDGCNSYQLCLPLRNRTTDSNNLSTRASSKVIHINTSDYFSAFIQYRASHRMVRITTVFFNRVGSCRRKLTYLFFVHGIIVHHQIMHQQEGLA